MPGITDDGQLMQVFYQETRSLIEQMREDLTIFHTESELGNPNREEQLLTLGRLFRCAHIVKSSAGTVGFDRLVGVSQALERIFKATSDGKLALTPDLVRSVGQGIQACRDILSGQEVPSWESLVESLKVTVSS
jgi:two-component system chemotaxis sensor kinase CheA